MTNENRKSETDIQKAAGFVTAGGRSSRMGRDKAWLDVGGKTMIERVIQALAPATSSVNIIANSDEYKRLGFPVFADTNIGIGPVEAIRTALWNAPTSRVVLAGCDMPFVTTELFSFLLDISGSYQAIIPTGPDGRLEPLCAVYSTEARAALTSLIESGGRKVSLLIDRVPTRIIAFKELYHLPGAKFFFQNVNTAEEYARAVEIIRNTAESRTES